MAIFGTNNKTEHVHIACSKWDAHGSSGAEGCRKLSKQLYTEIF